jgi:hypothetical protein
VVDGKRSALPEDFEESDVDLLAQIAEEANEPLLQARLADLVWLLKRPRSYRHALLAIDAYRQTPLDLETWTRGGEDCWKRAISLCRTLRGGVGERIREIEAAVLLAFDTTNEEGGFFCFWLAQLMLRNGLGKEQQPVIAAKLECLGRTFDSLGELHRAREYFAASAKWYLRGNNATKATEMKVCVAEGWAKEAKGRISSDRPSHLVATDFYEKAIQVYRTIPKSARPIYRVEERIAELLRCMSEAGEKAVDEMKAITHPGIDITEIVDSARNAVRGKTVTDALYALSNIHPGFRVQELQDETERGLREFPLQALFSSTHISHDGRVIAKQLGMGFGDEEFKETLRAGMVRNFGMDLRLVVQGLILPALGVVVLEHRIPEGEFIALAARSPIVPIGRARLFGRALFAGYDGDFAVALHLLVPQIEQMVRSHLKAAGVRTTNLDLKGIENENSLSTLMDLPEVGQLFGEDIAFEIKALFCDPLGPNLRNELAHGLLDDDHCESIYSVYAWWLGLKLVFNNFWNALRNGVEPESEGEEPELDEKIS